MIETDRADYSRAKLDRDLILSVASHVLNVPLQSKPYGATGTSTRGTYTVYY